MEYERSRRIQASENDVFAFLANVQNLPNFLPTVQSAEVIADDRIRMRGKNHGVAYADDGWIHIDPDRHRLEWGDDEQTYSGWMAVSGDDGASEVVAHLSLAPRFDQSGRPLSGESPNQPDPVEEGLEAAMDSLRNLIEGRDGKEQPATTM
jgi:hypothetical protein